MSDLDLIFRGVSLLMADADRHMVHRRPTSLPVAYDNGIHIHEVAASYDVRDNVSDELRGRLHHAPGYGTEWDEDDAHDSYYWDVIYPDLLRDSPAFWVEPDLCTVIDHAGHYLPDTHLLSIEDVPTETGVVTFGATVGEAGALGDDGTDVLYWHRTPRGLILRTLTPARPHDPWPIPCTMAFHWGRIDRDVPTVAVLVAFWLFIDQKIPRLTERQAPRQLRRHYLRDAPTLHTTTVCTLRRRESRPDDPRRTDVEWSHRWLVSGHWREQWYPSTEEHKTIWIAPYVKGPDELPLVHKDRAFMVIR